MVPATSNQTKPNQTAKAFWNLFLFLSKLIRKLSAKVFSIMLSSVLMFGSVKVKANFQLIVSNEFTAGVVKVY